MGNVFRVFHGEYATPPNMLPLVFFFFFFFPTSDVLLWIDIQRLQNLKCEKVFGMSERERREFLNSSPLKSIISFLDSPHEDPCTQDDQTRCIQ